MALEFIPLREIILCCCGANAVMDPGGLPPIPRRPSRTLEDCVRANFAYRLRMHAGHFTTSCMGGRQSDLMTGSAPVIAI